MSHVELQAGGLTFHAVTAGPTDGPLVILLHGFPELWMGWRRQIAPLAEAGFRVVVPDQRGYGGSDKPSSVSDYSLDNLARDVAAIADACRASSFDVVGHDWGGLVAWWTALKYPKRVRRLIAVNAPHPVAARRYARRHWRQRMRSWYIFFFQIPRLPEWLLSFGNYALMRLAVARSAPKGLFTEEDFRAYREAWSVPGALTAMLNWYRALLRVSARVTDVIVKPPTLVLWGDRDAFLEFGLAEESVSLCERGRVVRAEGASHWLQHERPEFVAREIVAFLSER